MINILAPISFSYDPSCSFPRMFKSYSSDILHPICSTIANNLIIINKQSSTTSCFHKVDDLGQYHFKHTQFFLCERGPEGGFILSNDEADLYATGMTLGEAEEDLLDELNMAWVEYALCDDSKLDYEAVKYKRWLLDNVEAQDR